VLFSCERITKCYEGVPTVKDVSLSLPEGGLISLLGASGVGKTTLFNVLAGVDTPEAGRVLLSGEDITGCAGRVSYMLQKDLLFPYRTVLDNVILPLILRGQPKREARDYARGFFARFGLSGYEDKYPRQISGGMRQRAALLRTTMTGNRVILLDEPFSALDAITKLSMHEWYLGIAEEMKLSTIFITHDIDEAVTLSDDVFILHGKPGRIVAQIGIAPERPRSRAFQTSPAFAEYKRKILDAIGL
jgi:ABC-type nitrate/sulfonate/bicarbonate transport system ATPase subunit